MNAVFYAMAVVTLLGGVGAATARGVVRAVLCAMLFFGGVGGVLLTLHAEFVAVAQVLVYVGAVGVLMLFALALTRSPALELIRGGRGWAWGMFAALAAGAVLWAAAGESSEWWPQAWPEKSLTAAEFGRVLFTRYALPFEIAGVLLTAALIGGASLASPCPADGPGPADGAGLADSAGVAGGTGLGVGARGRGE